MEKDIQKLIDIAREALYMAYNWAPDCDEDGDGYVKEAQKNLRKLDKKLRTLEEKYK